MFFRQLRAMGARYGAVAVADEGLLPVGSLCNHEGAFRQRRRGAHCRRPIMHAAMHVGLVQKDATFPYHLVSPDDASSTGKLRTGEHTSITSSGKCSRLRTLRISGAILAVSRTSSIFAFCRGDGAYCDKARLSALAR